MDGLATLSPPLQAAWFNIMKKLVEQGHELVLNGEVAKSCMVCLRIARILNDYLNTAIFLFEVSSDYKAAIETFIQDSPNISTEAQKHLIDMATRRYVRERDLSPRFMDGNRVYDKGIGEIESSLQNAKESLGDYSIPEGMSPFDTAAFEDSGRSRKEAYRLWISLLSGVREKVRARCLNYLIAIEKQIRHSEASRAFQNFSVNNGLNYFKRESIEIHQKLMKLCDLAQSPDKETRSHILTSIRRSIQAIADHFFPPVQGLHKCLDGIDRELGNDQYLNRLQEYILKSLSKCNSRDLLILEVQNLAAVIRKLNDLSSKGVHSDVSKEEANYCLNSFFNFVGNLILITEKTTFEQPL